MNAAEFRPIAADIQGRWSAFKIPASGLEQFVRDLRDLAIDDVAAAVASLGNDGRDRPPTPGHVRRRVVEMQLDAPAWPEARAALSRWRAGADGRVEAIEAWTCPAGRCDGSGFVVKDRDATNCVCRPARLAKLRGLDQLPVLVAEFVGVAGQVSNGELDVLFGKGDTQLDAQVRGRWEQFVRRILDSRMLAALPAGDGLARIEAARGEDRARDERGGGLRRIDTVALLERGA